MVKQLTANAANLNLEDKVSEPSEVCVQKFSYGTLFKTDFELVLRLVVHIFLQILYSI